MPLVALSPALAPLLGVVIFENFGWRSIFIVAAIIGVVLLLYTSTLNNSLYYAREDTDLIFLSKFNN